MFDKELLFLLKPSVGRADDGRNAWSFCTITSRKIATHTRKPRSRRPLKQSRRRGSQPEIGRDQPEKQMQRAHRRQRFGGLRENPRTGAKPISSTVMRASKPATNPHTSTNRACEPLKQVKM